jgi:hypothetical protein
MFAMKGDNPAWFRKRRYPHFDRPLTIDQATALVTNPDLVTRHSFLPFMCFKLVQLRYKRKERKVVTKERPVAFASHADSHIFAYYAHMLIEKYEQELSRLGISESVLAYRRFNPPKCNIHFANDAFAAIERRVECEVQAFDVESFFDSIPHDVLKRMWARVLGAATLPEDHYRVYKAITTYSTVERDAVFAEFSIGKRRQKRFRGPICTPLDFRERVRGKKLITRNPFGEKGVPQGSPISAVLSNIVMLELDSAMSEACAAVGGVYRRYSDDILLVGPKTMGAGLKAKLEAELSKLRLSLNHSKTNESVFGRRADGLLDASAPLQYLGFIFDGQRVLVRPQTLARYIQRMKRGVRSARRAATTAEKRGGSGVIRRRELFARYSHLGPTKAMKLKRRPDEPKGNFWTYAKRASKTMGTDDIRRQLRKYWVRLNAEIAIHQP